MAVKLRLKRFGRRNRPFYRIVAIDGRRARDSITIEDLGYYDPIAKDEGKRFKVDSERVKYWLGVGAQPSETVKNILKKVGIPVKTK